MFDCGIHPSDNDLSSLPYFDLINPQNSLAAYNVTQVKNEEGVKFLKFEKNRLIKNEGDLIYSYIFLGK